MKVIIYGKDNCVHCDKTRMLCQIKSIEFQYHTVGSDISVQELHERIGHPATALPQIFLDHNQAVQYVGGYDDLRSTLRQLA